MRLMMPLDRKATRTLIALIGLTLLTPGFARPEPKKAHVDSMLRRLAKASEKAVQDHGRPDAIETDELAFFEKVVAAGRDKKDGRPVVRIRLQLDDAARQALEAKGIKTYGQMAGFASAIVPLDRIDEVAGVEGVERMQAVRVPKLELDISRNETGSSGMATTYGANGQGVIYGAIDSGINWSHQDFRKADGTTRIKYLWNQDDSCVGPPPAPPFDFGCLYTEAQINAALLGGPTITAPDADGHGTHTVGVGAGNGRGTGNGRPSGVYVGMAPQADIIFVKIFPEPGDPDCPTCFAISDAMDFIDAKAAELGKPYSINMSFGSQYGAHDGSDLDEVTIDTLTGPGKAGKITAKSAGNERGHRIHFSGTLTQGQTITHQLVVPTYTPLPGAFNDTVAWSIWYSNGDTLTVKINDPTTTPCGSSVLTVTNTTGGGNIGQNTTSGTIIIDDSASPLPNGTRFFDAEIDDQGSSAPCRGTWTFQVTGTNITAGGHYDGWIWYNGFGSAAAEALWAAASADLTNLLSIPGSSVQTTTVGAYTTKPSWTAADGLNYSWNPAPTNGTLASFSSPGPTRDGRLKPEITAPGFGVSSTLSIDATPLAPGDAPLQMPDLVHWILPGTSFSAPHIAGIYAQLLSINPTLDAAQAKQILIATARVDNFVTPTPNNDWGFGKVGALAAANLVNQLTQQGPSFFMTQSNLFSFVGVPGATAYNVYRGLLSARSLTNYGSCFQSHLPANSFTDASNPPAGDGYMYYMTAIVGGVEGSLGNRSNGTARPNSSPCP
ncbi:MAG TPA: S8 family serine peptidase [Candidatus Polarisedimenticolia bacterium]|nr:S8 family serine peptidase [Candidatus Polarisedimenticolia bacterium]